MEYYIYMLTDIYTNALSFLGNNQFASGGLLIGTVGVIVASLRRVPSILWTYFLRTFSVEVEVGSSNELFAIIEHWFSKNQVGGRIRSFRAKYIYEPPSLSKGGGSPYLYSEDSLNANKKIEDGIQLSPGLGTHWFWHNGFFFIIQRKRLDQNNNKTSISSKPNEEDFHLRIFSRNIKRAKDFLTEAVTICNSLDATTIRIYLPDYSSWTLSGRKKKRCPDALVLKDTLLTDLQEDIGQFLTRESWYADRGVPYRRGYLFVGPPGNGKTSTIATLASMFDSPIYCLDLSNSGMSDSMLKDLMSRVPKAAFILLEDVDAMFKSRKKKVIEKKSKSEKELEELFTEEESSKVTFSGLLNALDGISTPEGHIIFMTTNHPEILDPALIRPGRVDKIVEFKNADQEQAKRMFLKFFKQDSSHCNKFSKLAGTEKFSMAKLQGILLQASNEVEAVDLIKNLDE